MEEKIFEELGLTESMVDYVCDQIFKVNGDCIMNEKGNNEILEQQHDEKANKVIALISQIINQKNDTFRYYKGLNKSWSFIVETTYGMGCSSIKNRMDAFRVSLVDTYGVLPGKDGGVRISFSIDYLPTAHLSLEELLME